jgi:hypothetical protein
MILCGFHKEEKNIRIYRNGMLVGVKLFVFEKPNEDFMLSNALSENSEEVFSLLLIFSVFLCDEFYAKQS